MANLTDRQLKDTFDLFDADASGAIDVDDVGLLMEALGFGKLPAEEIEDIVRQTDRDESRVIEFDDYRRMVRSKAAHDNSPEEMRLAFNYFDHGSKGAVTVHDFCKVAERLAEEPRPDLYNEIIREAAGADAEGINYENWSSLHREVNADKDGMMKLQFNLKFAAKQFANDSKRCAKEEKAAKSKAAKAIAKGLDENARIYAQQAIQKKNEQTNFLRLSSRLDAVSSKVATAVKMRNVTKTMGGVVKGMDKALQSMRYDEITRVMDTFEQQIEDLDVAMEYTEQAMGQTTALTTPATEVDGLLEQIADENKLEYKSQMHDIGVGKNSLAQPSAASTEDDLSARLAKLKGDTPK